MMLAANVCFQGLRNDLKAAMDKIDQQYLNEIVGGTESGEMDTQHDLKVHEENTTIEELEVHTVHRVMEAEWDTPIEELLSRLAHVLVV